MKVAILLLVCFVAVASAAVQQQAAPVVAPVAQVPATPAGNEDAWKAWATRFKDPASSIKWKESAVAPTKAYIISDAGSQGTRMIIGIPKKAAAGGKPAVAGAEVTLTGLFKIVKPNAANDRPAVLEAFQEVLAVYPEISFITLGATAGARNEMWLAGAPDVATRIGQICPTLQRANGPNAAAGFECAAGIIQGTVEGFLGWYDAWKAKNYPGAGLCYMEFGGMSVQLAANVDTAANPANQLSRNVLGSLSGSNARNTISLAVLSGMQLGFNVIADEQLQTTASPAAQAAAAALGVCDARPVNTRGANANQVAFNFADCKRAVNAFYAKDAPLGACVGTYRASLRAACGTLTVKDKAPWTTFNDAGAKFLADIGRFPHTSAQVDTWVGVAHCQEGGVAYANDVVAQARKPWFTCARLILWNKFMQDVFGDDGNIRPNLDDVDNEWFNGLKSVLQVNNFDGLLIETLLSNNVFGAQGSQTHKALQTQAGQAVSDCLDITGTTGFPTGRPHLRLRTAARHGRRMGRVSGLRLKF